MLSRDGYSILWNLALPKRVTFIDRRASHGRCPLDVSRPPLAEINRCKPVERELSLNIVDQTGRPNGQNGTEEDEGKEIPPQLRDGRIDGREESRRSGRWVNGLRQRHGGRGKSTSHRSGDPPQTFEVGTQLEQLRDRDPNDGRDEVAGDGVPRLRQRRLDGVVLQNGRRTLLPIVSTCACRYARRTKGNPQSYQ